jgi:hypothetical protein
MVAHGSYRHFMAMTKWGRSFSPRDADSVARSNPGRRNLAVSGTCHGRYSTNGQRIHSWVIYIYNIYIYILYMYSICMYIYIIYMCILYYYIISSIDRQTMKNIVDQRTSKCPRRWFPALAFRGTSSVRYLREVQDLSSGASCWGWSSLPKKSKKGREDTSLFSTFVCICIHLSCAFISIHFYPFLIFNKPGRNCNLNILKLQN